MGLKPRRKTVKKERPKGNNLFYGKKFLCPGSDIIYHIIAETYKDILIEWTDARGHKQEINYTVDDAIKYTNDRTWILI